MVAHNIYKISTKNKIKCKIRETKIKLKKIGSFLWYYVSDLVTAITIFALILLSMLFFLAGA